MCLRLLGTSVSSSSSFCPASRPACMFVPMETCFCMAALIWSYPVEISVKGSSMLPTRLNRTTPTRTFTPLVSACRLSSSRKASDSSSTSAAPDLSRTNTTSEGRFSVFPEKVRETFVSKSLVCGFLVSSLAVLLTATLGSVRVALADAARTTFGGISPIHNANTRNKPSHKRRVLARI